MKISNIKVELTEADIISIIEEFVQVDGLKIHEACIGKNIVIKGSYENRIKIAFQAVVDIVSVNKKEIIVKLSKVKVAKLGIFRLIRSFALKKVFELIKLNGLYSNKDNIIINLENLLKDFTFVDFNVCGIYLKEHAIQLEVEDIKVSLKGELIKTVKETNTIEEKEEIGEINKIEDNYSKGREILKDKMPEKITGISDYLFIIPDLVTLIYRLLKDSRVPMKTKIVVSVSITYIAFPRDFIPDSIPFIGKIDDLAVVLFALNKIANDVPTKVILENWSGKDDFIEVLKNGLSYISELTGVKNVEKLYNIAEELSTL